jgi:type I restriction enzyme S subunit
MEKPKIRFKGYTEDWEQRKLGDVSESYSGGTPSVGNKSYYGGSIPFIRSAEINSESTELFLTEEGVANSSARMVSKGDILYALYGATSGEVGRSLINGAINQAILAILPHDGYDSEFLMQWLRRSKQNIIDVYLQGGQGNLSGTIVKALEVNFPSLVEQRQIGNYFQSLDHLITLHQRKCEETKRLKKYMLQKMFPQNGKSVPEIRFAGFTDAWEQRKLDDVVEFLDTMRKPLEGAKRVPGPYPYYGASGIVDYIDGYLFDEELILLSEDGANITDRNYPVCFLAFGKYWVNNHAHVLRIKQGNENNFICNSLERKDYTQYNTGMAMPKLNKETCKKIPILCPVFEEQKKIGDYFRGLDHLITLHQRKCDELKNMKKYMLQNMFI